MEPKLFILSTQPHTKRPVDQCWPAARRLGTTSLRSPVPTPFTWTYSVNDDVLALRVGGVVGGDDHVDEEPLVLGPHQLPRPLGGLGRVVAGQEPDVSGCGGKQGDAVGTRDLTAAAAAGRFGSPVWMTDLKVRLHLCVSKGNL